MQCAGLRRRTRGGMLNTHTQPPPAARHCRLAEYREQAEGGGEALKGPILELLASAGLQVGCPRASAIPEVLAQKFGRPGLG